MKISKRLNPFTGKFDLIADESMFHVKDPVDTHANLPITGNGENDMRFVEDTDKAYVWSIANPDGNLADWKLVDTVRSEAEIKSIAKTDVDIADAILKKHTQNTDEYLSTQVTKTLFVDKNRTDIYTENGSITKPFKTIQAAITIANGNVLINVAPGEYAGDFSLGAHVVGIRGSGINATIFTGNITAGDRAHSLDEFRIKSTGSLTITDTVFARNLHLECAVIVSGSGFLDGCNIYIKPISGIVPLTVTSTGGVMLNEGSILGSGNVNAINQSSGTIVLFHSYAKNSSLTTPTINSSGGILGLIDVSVYNIGFGVAVNMNNGGSALSANSLSGLVCSGNIVCGSATTYVEGLNFVGFGALSGSALIYRPASRLNNDSSVVGATVKDALETLDAKPGVTHLVVTNSIILQANGANFETINHALAEQFVQATVSFKPSAGTYSGQWINGEGVITLVYFDQNNLRIYNDSGSAIAIGDCKIIIQK